MRRASIIIPVLSSLVIFQQSLFSQNVGIGNPNPQEKLDVSGNIAADTIKPDAIRMTPNAGDGKVMTSDAQGNGTWQALSMQNDPEDGNLGYGVWGDCQTNSNISEYQPIADTIGTSQDFYGNAVEISGDYAIVGAPNDDVDFYDQGSAHVYYHNGTEWQYIQRLTDPMAGEDDAFGSSVCISGNYAFVGSGEDDEVNLNQGSVCVFLYDGVSWNFVQKLVDPAGGVNDNLGYGRVSASGNFMIAGAPSDHVGYAGQGSASIFQFNGSTWEYMTKLSEADGSANDWFGISVSMSGDYCVVGISRDDDGGAERGSAMIFHYDGTNWTFQQKISDPQGAANDLFGSSVDIDGSNVIIGVPYDNEGLTFQGSACLFRRSGTNWSFIQKIKDSTAGASDYFGTSVAISADYALVGSIYDTMGSNVNVGSATLFQKVGASWLKYQEIFDPASGFPDYFGNACSLDMTTQRFIVGAYGFNTSMGKVVFGKIR